MNPTMALYYFILIVELIIAVGVTIYAGAHLYSSLMGAPYVPTVNRIVDEILAAAQLKKGQLFMELGSGDGRIVRRAATLYGVHGVGIEINPVLVFIARLRTKMEHLTQVEFRVKNIYEVNLKEVDVMYLFLMPKMLERLKPKLVKQAKDNLLVISHGFKIPGLDAQLEKTIDRRPFPTYYYRFHHAA